MLNCDISRKPFSIIEISFSVRFFSLIGTRDTIGGRAPLRPPMLPWGGFAPQTPGLNGEETWNMTAAGHDTCTMAIVHVRFLFRPQYMHVLWP